MFRKPKIIAMIVLAFAIAVAVHWIGFDRPNFAQSPMPETTLAANSLQLAPPIDCTLDEDCFILLYPDRDPGPGEVDFGCGRQTYDGHKGTDFGIANTDKMNAGVAVIASAPGKVLRVRDGVNDRLITDPQQVEALDGRECGNGVFIEHGNGWETQYCHLRNGSVAVRPGMEVETGTVLGMVGASGAASFPHVHITALYQGQVVDPFVGPEAGPGCQVSRSPLWTVPLDYTPTGAIDAGFADTPPEIKDLWEGGFPQNELSKDIPALLFWVHTYGVLPGDSYQFKLIAPNGQAIAEDRKEITSPSKTWMGYVGKRNNPDRPILPGVWRGEYQLTRGGEVLVDLVREIEVR
ncbi:M23 family metallopeptidase [Laspinema sp. A4]|uniref:M23 family metallopeptidase n=1 Tax=Laspinema sp. D2d TaxID=2953686 RepID=UPI0021BB2AD1|nr:M23 family metallopeptidase [Laspinema sp. D2d]MCT7983491.1 M23 family metallopeptidase [Laspinema sp. D2d]